MFLQTYLIVVVCQFIGCVLPQAIKPLRLYDVKNGNIIEVLVRSTSPTHGKLTSYSDADFRFEGEFVIGEYQPSGRMLEQSGTWSALKDSIPTDLPELYGFSKNFSARPAGTGILVGEDNTVIEIVFYKISRSLGDVLTGDGVAKDNKGRYYRVFMSTEEL